MKISVTTHVTIEQSDGQTTSLVETREFENLGDNPAFIPMELNQAMTATGLPILDMAQFRWGNER